jgi:hypothetical protein
VLAAGLAPASTPQCCHLLLLTICSHNSCCQFAMSTKVIPQRCSLLKHILACGHFLQSLQVMTWYCNRVTSIVVVEECCLLQAASTAAICIVPCAGATRGQDEWRMQR